MDAAAKNPLPSTATKEGDSEVAAETPHNQGAVASSSPTNDATDENATGQNANLPLFRLPRELRNMVYDLVFESEEKVYYDISLEAAKEPHITLLTTNGASRTCRQLQAEYAATVEGHVRHLMSYQRADGINALGPRPLLPNTKRRASQLEVSLARCEYNSTQDIRCITIRVPVRVYLKLPSFPFMGYGPTLFFTFKFPNYREYGPPKSLFLQRGRLDGNDEYRYMLPSCHGPALQRAIEIVKATKWKGHVRWYMLWQSQVIRYTRVLTVEEDRYTVVVDPPMP